MKKILCILALGVIGFQGSAWGMMAETEDEKDLKIAIDNGNLVDVKKHENLIKEDLSFLNRALNKNEKHPEARLKIIEFFLDTLTSMDPNDEIKAFAKKCSLELEDLRDENPKNITLNEKINKFLDKFEAASTPAEKLKQAYVLCKEETFKNNTEGSKNDTKLNALIKLITESSKDPSVLAQLQKIYKEVTTSLNAMMPGEKNERGTKIKTALDSAIKALGGTPEEVKKIEPKSPGEITIQNEIKTEADLQELVNLVSILKTDAEITKIINIIKDKKNEAKIREILVANPEFVNPDLLNSGQITPEIFTYFLSILNSKEFNSNNEKTKTFAIKNLAFFYDFSRAGNTEATKFIEKFAKEELEKFKQNEAAEQIISEFKSAFDEFIKSNRSELTALNKSIDNLTKLKSEDAKQALIKKQETLTNEKTEAKAVTKEKANTPMPGEKRTFNQKTFIDNTENVKIKLDKAIEELEKSLLASEKNALQTKLGEFKHSLEILKSKLSALSGKLAALQKMIAAK